MALEIKQSLKLTQSLVITPQLQQAIKLLQLSRVELSDLVQKELLENPCLETGDESANKESESQNASENEEAPHQAKSDSNGDASLDEVGSKDGNLKEPKDFDWENYIGNYHASEYSERSYASNASSEDLPTFENTVTRTASLQDHLFWQLGLLNFARGEEEVAIEILGNINDDGYLTSSVEEIAQKLDRDLETVERVLRRIQEDFDPTGIGARDTKEALLLQCDKLRVPEVFLLKKLIRNHLEDLERNNFKKAAKEMSLPVPKIMELARIIHEELDPRPGRPYSDMQPQYITPDVYVHKINGEYVLNLNEDGLPKLSISPLYRRAMMAPQEMDGKGKEYIQEKLRSALWLIKSIHQRQRTLYKVTKSIVQFQQDFFEKGPTFLKPMVLKDVADDIGMHESTVSRVTTNKYVHTPRGLFELKYFFNSSVSNADGGEGVSSEAVKEYILKFIQKEDEKKPLSDQDLVALLQKNFQVNVARRTVAKYRESLNILPSSKRRRRE